MKKAQGYKLRAAVFDLDDCIFPEWSYVASGYRAVGERLGDLTGRADDFESWLWRRFLSGQAGGAFDALNREFNLGLSIQQVHQLVEVYREHRPTIIPYGGMIDMLGRLRGHYRIGLLTDGFLPAQRLKVEALGIGRFLEAAVFTEEIGRDFWKPSTRGFELIAQQLGVENAQCAYIGDNPTKDFVAPNALGWRSIQLLMPGQVHSRNAAPAGGEPQIIARDLEDLYRALLSGE